MEGTEANPGLCRLMMNNLMNKAGNDQSVRSISVYIYIYFFFSINFLDDNIRRL